MALGWYAMSRQRAYAHAFIPLHSIGAAFVESVASGDLPRSVLGSLGRALMALTLGTLAGVAFGASLGAIRALDRVIGPLFHAFRQVPHLGLAPLMGLWFGTGEFAKVILVFLAVFYPIVLWFIKAFAPSTSDSSRWPACTFYREQTFTKVLFPAVLPYVYSGLSQAIAFAWIATIGSEMLLSTGNGVGTMMQHAGAGARLDVVLVCVLTIGIVSMSIDYLVGTWGRSRCVGATPGGL